MKRKIRITKQFNFETAHALYGYDGLCKNVHGHSYKLYVTVIGDPIDDTNHKKNGMLIDFSDLKKIKTAARHIEDIYEDMVDTEMSEKEKDKEVEVEKKNEQSEGHGEMYNALKGVREGKVVKINQDTLQRIVERVIKEQK